MPPPDDRHPGGLDAGDPADQLSGTPVDLLQVVRPFLNGQPARHLAHGFEQGQLPVGHLNRLVGDPCNASLHHFEGQFPLRGQMQIGEQGQVGTQEVVLRRKRLLDLDHEAGVPCLGGAGDDMRTGRPVLVIAEPAASACPGLDEDAMARLAQHPNPSGGHGHSELLILDLPGNAYDHGHLPVLSKNFFPGPNGRDGATIKNVRKKSKEREMIAPSGRWDRKCATLHPSRAAGPSTHSDGRRAHGCNALVSQDGG